MKKIVVFILFLIGVVAGVIFVQAMINQSAMVQPIKFNHQLHHKKMGIDCIFCHKYVETESRASIPNIDVCGICHLVLIGNSSEEKKVHEYVKNQKRIPWLSIYHVSDYASFSHRRHVAIGKLSCNLCHGDMGTLTSPPEKQFLKIKMENCINCHEKRHVSTDCNQCHR